MTNFVPFQPSGDLDLQVRSLLRAMLEPLDLSGREELLEQVPAVSVVGRYELDCLLEVKDGRPASPVSSKEPVVCALVDGKPEDVEIFGEPYIGELELFVQRGLLHILVYSPWCGPTELPDPVDIHPTAEIRGYVVVDESRYRKGWSFSRGGGLLYGEK